MNNNTPDPIPEGLRDDVPVEAAAVPARPWENNLLRNNGCSCETCTANLAAGESYYVTAYIPGELREMVENTIYNFGVLLAAAESMKNGEPFDSRALAFPVDNLEAASAMLHSLIGLPRNRIQEKPTEHAELDQKLPVKDSSEP